MISTIALSGFLSACGTSSVDGTVDAGQDGPQLPAAFPGPCLIQTDIGINDTIDLRDQRTYVDGRLTRIEQDNNVDGTTDLLQTRQYDADDRLVVIDDDNGADGVIDFHHTFIYDGRGRLERIEIDIGNNGIVNRVQTHQYDPDDRLVLIEDDLDNIAPPEHRLQHKYNVAGQLTLIERDDTPFDGLIALREARTYDNEFLRTQEFDNPSPVNGLADGVVDSINTFIRDGNGVVLQLQRDVNADGIGDILEYWSYECFQ